VLGLIQLIVSVFSLTAATLAVMGASSGVLAIVGLQLVGGPVGYPCRVETLIAAFF
jgi:hypothetical protein